MSATEKLYPFELSFWGLNWIEDQAEKIQRLTKIDKLFSWLSGSFCIEIQKEEENME